MKFFGTEDEVDKAETSSLKQEADKAEAARLKQGALVEDCLICRQKRIQLLLSFQSYLINMFLQKPSTLI